jgi:hypothetical protein
VYFARFSFKRSLVEARRLENVETGAPTACSTQLRGDWAGRLPEGSQACYPNLSQVSDPNGECGASQGAFGIPKALDPTASPEAELRHLGNSCSLLRNLTMKTNGAVCAAALMLLAACATNLTPAPQRVPSSAAAMGSRISSARDSRGIPAAPSAPLATSTPLPPPLYVTDANGVLWTVTTSGKKVRQVGSEGVVLTDIAFDPKDGDLYGVSFTDFYRVNKRTGSTTHIGSTGLDGANALIFDRDGHAFTASYDTTGLYSLNVKTGAATLIGSNGYWNSAGALTFYNGRLVLSGTVPDSYALVWLDARNGKIQKTVTLAIGSLYGLASVAKNVLYGFAGTDFYRIIPNAKDIHKRTSLIVDLDALNPDVAQIYGSTYEPVDRGTPPPSHGAFPPA